MKGLALFLVLLNVMYFAWAQWHAPEEPQVTQGATPAVPTLVLATEAELHGEGSAAPPPQESTAARASDRNTASVDTPLAAARSESRSGESPAVPTEAPVPIPDPELLTGVQRCVSIGAFRNLAEVGEAAATLRTSGYEPRTRVAEGDVWAGL